MRTNEKYKFILAREKLCIDDIGDDRGSLLANAFYFIQKKA